MKTILHQNKTMFFTVGGNQHYSLCEVEIDDIRYFSVGIENVSFALYRKQKHAQAALLAVLAFINDDTRTDFQFTADVAVKR